MGQTIEEIRAAYPREWVLIVDCEDDESGRLAAGRVLAHSPRRKEVYARLAQSGCRGWAVQYTGPVPKDQLYML